MKWRDSDTSCRPVHDGGVTDAGVLRFLEIYTEALYHKQCSGPESNTKLNVLGQRDHGCYLVKYRKEWEMVAMTDNQDYTVSAHEIPQATPHEEGVVNLIAQERKGLLESAGIEEDPNEHYVVLMMKGPAEKVVSCCSTALVNGQQIDRATFANRIIEIHEKLAGKGEFALGFAQIVTTQRKLIEFGIAIEDQWGMQYDLDSPEAAEALWMSAKISWMFLGLISLFDPPLDPPKPIRWGADPPECYLVSKPI